MLAVSMKPTALACCCALLSVLAGGAAVVAQNRPLPDLDSFLKHVRVHLQPDDARRSAYAYTYTQRRVTLDGAGHPRGETVKVIESYPGFGPGEPRWERVIEEGGKRVADAELQKKDAGRQKKAEEYLRRLQNDGERAKMAGEREKELRQIGETVDDVFRVYAIAMLGRETIDGHDTIAFSFSPKPGAKPRTREGKWLQAFQGRAWISESDYELVKLDVTAIDNLSFGLLVARIHKGATMVFTRRKVNGDEWLPAREQYSLNARILLLKGMHEEGTLDFSNYRKFSVETSTTVAAPKPPG
jgi:hypothetical protein